MGFMDQFEPQSGSFMDQFETADPYVSRIRGTMMDLVSHFVRGTGQTTELTGASLEQMGAEDIGGSVRGFGQDILKTDIAKPDIQEALGEEPGILKGSAQVVAEGIPQILGAAGAAVGTSMVAGPIAGGAAGLAFAGAQVGPGTYKMALEEIQKARPDMTPEQHHEFAWDEMVYETVPEVASMAAGGLVGKLLGSKVLMKQGLKALVKSGTMTTEDIIAAATVKEGLKDFTKAAIVGGSLEGGGEVWTALQQEASRRAVGIDVDPTDKLNLFLGSFILGEAPTALGYKAGTDKLKKARAAMEWGLNNESEEIRMTTVNHLSNKLEAIDPESGKQLRDLLTPMAKQGPMSLEALVAEEEQKAKVINSPQEILKESGIPTVRMPGVPSTDPADPFKVAEAHQLQGFKEKYTQDASGVQQAVATELDQRLNPKTELTEDEKVDLEDFRRISKSTIPDVDFKDIFVDTPVRNSIKQGIQDIRAAEEKLKTPSLTLVERNRFKKIIENTTKLIHKEVEDVKGVREAPTMDKPVDSRTDSKVDQRLDKVKTLVNAVEQDKEIPKVAPILNPKVDTRTGLIPGGNRMVTEATSKVKETTSKKTQEEVPKSVKKTTTQATLQGTSQSSNVEPSAAKEVLPVTKSVPKVEPAYSIQKGNQTKGKGAKVVNKITGVEYRATNEEAARKAIESGTVESLPLFNEVKRRTKRSDLLSKGSLTAEQKALGESYIESTDHYDKIQVAEENLKEAERILNDTKQEASKEERNDIVEAARQERDKLIEGLSKDWEAVSLVLKENKEVSKATVKEAKKYLEKQSLNELESQKAAREGQGVSTVGEMFDSATSDIEEGVEAVSLKGKKGQDVLKKVTEIQKEDGSWKQVAAEKVPKGSVSRVRELTPDKQYEMISSKSEDNRVTFSVVTKDGTEVASGLSDRSAAQDAIKNHKAELKTAEVDTVIAKEKADEASRKPTIVRRRKASDVDMELSDDLIAQAFEEGQANPLLNARRKLLDMPVSPEQQKALEDINQKIKQRDFELQEFELKFPNGLALLEHAATQKSDNPVTKKLAQFLLDNVDHKKLEGITITLGWRNYHKSGVVFLKADAQTSTMVHEMVHALTVREMEANPALRAKVRELMDVVQKEALSKGYITQKDIQLVKSLNSSVSFLESRDKLEGSHDVAYGLLNEKEFLAMTFGSARFQQVLREIPGATEKSIWRELLDYIWNVFGWDRQNTTMLEDVIMLTREIATGESLETQEIDLELPKIEAIDTDKATAEIMRTRQEGNKIREKLKEHSKNISNLASDTLRPISDRIYELNKNIHGALMKWEAQIPINKKTNERLIEPFLKWYTSLSESQKVYYDLALMNSQTEKNQRILKTIPKDAWEGRKKFLEGYRQRANEVGLNVGEEDEWYTPRRVSDVNKLMDYLLQDREFKGKIGYEYEQEAKRLGLTSSDQLTAQQRAQIVTDYLQSGHLRHLPTPGASKQRTLPFVTPETYKFYSNSADALIGHMLEMEEKVGMREFIGGSTRKKQVEEMYKEASRIEAMPDGKDRELALAKYMIRAEKLENLEADLQNGIAALVANEMGRETGEKQEEVLGLLDARLRQRGAHGVADLYRNTSYALTMGNFLSAITQLAETPIALANVGTLDAKSIKAIGSALRSVGSLMYHEVFGKKANLDAFVADADFVNSMREFSQNSHSAKLVDWLFKYTGLKYADLLGKESFMRIAHAKWADPKNTEEFLKKFTPMFGEETQRVLSEFQSGKKTHDVLAALIAHLSDWQPVSLSQQSKVYLKSGNGRVFYMLKTYTLRTNSAILRESKDLFKEGRYTKGASKMVAWVLLYALAGASADELKDLLRGREVQPSDNVIDNILQMGFMPKFTLEKGMQQGNLITAFVSGIVPPWRYADNFADDLAGMILEDKEVKFKSLQSLPFVGSIAYGQSPAGQASYASMEKKSIMEEIKSNKRSGKGAYSGGLSERIRKYNSSGVSRDKMINNDTVMTAYADKKRAS